MISRCELTARPRSRDPREAQTCVETDSVFRLTELKHASVHLDEILRDGESESSSLLFVDFTVDLRERLERPGMLRFGYSGATIPDREDSTVILHEKTKLDRAIWTAELHSIAEDVMEGVNDMNIVDVDDNPESLLTKPIRKMDHVLSGRFLEGIERHFGEEQRRDITPKTFATLGRLSELDLLEQQKVIDQSLEPLATALDRSKQQFQLWNLHFVSICENLGTRLDRDQRCAELMRECIQHSLSIAFELQHFHPPPVLRKSEPSADNRDQLIRIEGLRDVIIAAADLPAIHVINTGQCGEKDKGNIIPFRVSPQLTMEIVAALARKHHVAHHDAWCCLKKKWKGGLYRSCRLNLKSVPQKDALEDPEQLHVVFNEEHHRPAAFRAANAA